ncbi:MAG: HAD-IC family P-type ATPase [Archaeoglobaceae archaeon]|nr:HAD-IC family P-type ATPase [Archaeoglobaceae archaeon]
MQDFSKISIEETLNKLNTSLRGLSDEEAEKRVEKYGYNEIPEKRINPVLKFLSYFWGPIPWMIEIAAILSLIIKHWVDFSIILTLLLLNGIVAFWQESKAQNIISLLRQKLAVNARVLRNNEWKTILARELVPGDIIKTKIGDIIPADIKLLEGDYLSVDESALTGESLPVDKKVGDIAYSGSIVRKGEMIAVVVATGKDTYFGKTVQLVEEAKTASSFQKMVIKIGDYLIILALILVSLTFFVAIFRKESILEMLRFALVLIVAAIPAAMPAVLSITMAIGALNLAKKHVVVTKLVSIEELAGVDVLCSDKTGTLTKNELTLAEPIPFNNYSKDDVILFAALASEKNGDAIDNAIFKVLNGSSKLSSKINEFKIIDFTPFDPVIKRIEAVVERDKEDLELQKVHLK